MVLLITRCAPSKSEARLPQAVPCSGCKASRGFVFPYCSFQSSSSQFYHQSVDNGFAFTYHGFRQDTAVPLTQGPYYCHNTAVPLTQGPHCCHNTAVPLTQGPQCCHNTAVPSHRVITVATTQRSPHTRSSLLPQHSCPLTQGSRCCQNNSHPHHTKSSLLPQHSHPLT